MAKRKFYVVWVGHSPGIYDTWEEAKAQINGFPGARYRAFESQTDATMAFRGDPSEAASLLRSIAAHKPKVVNYEAIPEIIKDSVAVDGACAKNPGPMEYRCVDVMTGAEIFHLGPLEDGTNNVAEYLALVHALAWLHQTGNTHTAIYSDSRTALAWLRNRKHKSTLVHTPKNAYIFQLLDRADRWLQTHNPVNRVLKWDTDSWGEIPADFGRK